ncbi:tRNA-specific 2-thiouridylase, partial [Papiliotrema laurentii]
MSNPALTSRLAARIKSGSCPIHGHGRYHPHPRRLASTVLSTPPILTPASVKALVPTMEDLVLWKWDKVTVAMSGGVDSAVVLRMLAEYPLDINVVFMRNWDSLLSENNDNDDLPSPASYHYSSDPSSSKSPNMSPCGWQKDWDMVQRVCDHVGVPRHRVRLVDLSKEYWAKVFEPALNVWEHGGTPNPDVACNREIKFGALFEHIPNKDRSFLATGHYARVKRVPHATRLCRAVDETKDQSYYLSSITDAQLRRAIMPLAQIRKEDVRKLAKYYGLPNANKEESMGLCFVGERQKFSKFISQYIPKPAVQGYIVDAEGKKLGRHDGLWQFTVGQKARLPGMLQPMFVARKCVGESGQDIMVVPGSDHPALMCTRIHTHDFHWIANKVPSGIVPGGSKRALVQIRHRMEPIPAVINHDWNGMGLTIDFAQPVHGVAPGQVCAIYYMKWCLGSGVIKQT